MTWFRFMVYGYYNTRERECQEVFGGFAGEVEKIVGDGGGFFEYVE